MTVRVFVYGTLKRGHPNHDVVSPWVESASEASIEGHALFDCGSYPAAWPATGGRVRGELFTLRDPDTALARLDDYEGEEYRRIEVDVQGASGTVRGWLYVLAAEPGADWRRLDDEAWDERGKPRLSR